MSKKSDGYQPRNVSMYPSQWRIVDALAAASHNGQVSPALRAIVDQWDQTAEVDKLLHAALMGRITPEEAIRELVSIRFLGQSQVVE